MRTALQWLRGELAAVRCAARMQPLHPLPPAPTRQSTHMPTCAAQWCTRTRWWRASSRSSCCAARWRPSCAMAPSTSSGPRRWSYPYMHL